MTSLPDAIFFDFDGVLCDSVAVKTDAFAALYAGEGKEIIDQVVVHHLEHGGISRFEKLRFYERTLLGREPDDRRIRELADHFADLVVDAVVQAPAIPGAERALESLHTRVPLYVVSGTPETELRAIVERRGWHRFFREVRGSPDPKSEILGSLIGKRGYDSRRCCMIGDAMTDYDAARESGVPFVGVQERSGSHPFPEATTVIPDLSVLEAAISEALGRSLGPG